MEGELDPLTSKLRPLEVLSWLPSQAGGLRRRGLRAGASEKELPEMDPPGGWVKGFVEEWAEE